MDDLFSQQDTLNPVRAEYQQLLDELIAGWVTAGRLARPPAPRNALFSHSKVNEDWQNNNILQYLNSARWAR